MKPVLEKFAVERLDELRGLQTALRFHSLWAWYSILPTTTLANPTYRDAIDTSGNRYGVTHNRTALHNGRLSIIMRCLAEPNEQIIFRARMGYPTNPTTGREDRSGHHRTSYVDYPLLSYPLVWKTVTNQDSQLQLVPNGVRMASGFEPAIITVSSLEITVPRAESLALLAASAIQNTP